MSTGEGPPPGRGRGRGRGRGLPSLQDDQGPQAPLPGFPGPPTLAGSVASDATGFSGLVRGRGRGFNLQSLSLEGQGALGLPCAALPELGVAAGQDAPALPIVPDLAEQEAAVPHGAAHGAAALPAAMEALQIEGVQAPAPPASGFGRGRGRGNLMAESDHEQSAALLSSSDGSSSNLQPETLTTRLSAQSGPKNMSDPMPSVQLQKLSPGPTKQKTLTPTELELPFEPMRGVKGERVQVTTNFLRLNIAEDMGIFEYHVDFDPQFDSIAHCKKIVYKLQEELGPTRTFDGAKLCLPKKLPADITNFEGENPSDPGSKVKVIVKYVKQIPLAECAHFYNILLRKVLEMTDLKEINRNYFDAQNIHQMPEHKLEIWSGYDTAIDTYDGGLMVCVETLHRVLRNTTSLEYLRSLRNTKPDWQEKFREAVVGRSILTRYNNKFYRIDDVDWNRNPTHTFPLRKTGQEITFIDYFANQYGAIISDKAQPMLLSRIKPRKNDPMGEIKTVLLVPELSYMTGLTEEITSNFNIMKDLIARTRISPVDRLKHIQDFTTRVIHCEAGSRLLASWGLSLDITPVQMMGRKIDGPGIRFNDRTIKQSPSDNDFARQATSAPCFRPVDFKKWMVFAPAQEQDKVRKMVDMIKAVVGQLGIRFTPPEIITVRGSGRFLNGNDYARMLMDSAQPDKVQFVVVILSQQRDELYSAVKKQCLVTTSIPSQVILARTLANEKKMRSIMQKVVLQINCKLGGALWGLEIPKDLKIMFVGIDAYHDPKRKNKSCLAMVVGLDNECSQHFSKMAFQTAHQEGSAVIGPLFQQCLAAYFETQRSYPQRVLVFRDGVGDGQMKELKAQEIDPIKQILKEHCPQMTKFSFVVVQKRINERIFKFMGGRSLENPSQGTVVDNTITRFKRYDFFLISQLVRQGTVGPTHYTVLDDSGEKKPDLLQKFAYALTFMYFNWPGTIRVPAVCQYAHKLAYLVGQHLMTAPKAEADNKLYYL